MTIELRTELWIFLATTLLHSLGHTKHVKKVFPSTKYCVRKTYARLKQAAERPAIMIPIICK